RSCASADPGRSVNIARFVERELLRRRPPRARGRSRVRDVPAKEGNMERDTARTMFARGGAWSAAAFAVGLAASGCQDADDDATCNEESVSMALQGGVALDWAGSRATVFIGECSGVLLSPSVIATAAHCVPTRRVLDEELPATHARLAVRGGARGDVCLTGGSAAGCAQLEFEIAVQPVGDVALLVSAQPLAGASS